MHRPPSSRALAPAALALSLALACLPACSKKDDSASLAPASSALTASSASSTSASASSTWHFAVDPKSTTHVDMPGLKEHIMGDTTAAAGTLDVVPGDLAQSRGLVRVDLTTFSTHTFNGPDDAQQTTHARTWLEAVVDGKTNEEMRWAEFAIRSLDNLSATDLAKVAPTRDGADDVRTITATVHGELLVHGRKSPKDGVVEVAFRYPAGEKQDGRPTRIEVKSRQPMHVVLKEHDIKPRDPAGQLLAWSTNLISKVADSADVTFALAAAPIP